MKLTRLFICAVLALSAAVCMTSCGQTYHLQSIKFAVPSVDIQGIGNYQSFIVYAMLSNGEQRDVTSKVTWSIAAPLDLPSTIQAEMLQGVVLTSGTAKQVQSNPNYGICTWAWVALKDDTGKITGHTYGTYPLVLTATYEGMTAQADVSVEASSPCYSTYTPALNSVGNGYGYPLNQYFTAYN